MRGSVIALNAAPFWLLCALGVLMMAPIASAVVRKWLLAALNAVFLAVLLGPLSIPLLGAVVLAWLLLQAIRRTRYRIPFAVLTAGGAAALFLLHKWPHAGEGPGLDSLGRVLSFIGYSYVALRLTEVLRALFEGRHPAPDLPSTLNYLLPFHMLAAGPIQGYDEFVRQPALPQPRSARDILMAGDRIATGLFKKFVLAFVVQKLLLTDFQSHGLYKVVELQAFFVWLFLDFSAYSDIAVGVGMLLGVATPENFNRPLVARNMIEFWDRWHISLSLFVRRNLFVPLQMLFMRRTGGGSALMCAVAATTLSFLICGLWHGLTVGFLAWGLAQASGLVAVRLYGRLLQRHLGTRGVKRYLANPWIRAAAVVVTFEFEASTLLTLFMN